MFFILKYILKNSCQRCFELKAEVRHWVLVFIACQSCALLYFVECYTKKLVYKLH